MCVVWHVCWLLARDGNWKAERKITALSIELRSLGTGSLEPGGTEWTDPKILSWTLTALRNPSLGLELLREAPAF